MQLNQNKKRVLMLYDFPIKGGGSGTYVKNLCLRLHEAHDYACAIASPDTTIIDTSIPQFQIRLPKIPVFLSRPGLEKSKKYNELSVEEIAEIYQIFIRDTIKAIREFKPDIIHVHHAFINAWTARFIKSMFNIKYIVTSHGSDLYAVLKDRRYFLMTRDALRGASTITVVSGDTRAKFMRTYGSDLSLKTRTVPGGVRFANFPDNKTLEEKKLIRDKYHLSSENAVLFTGRLISEKGVEYLVKAASKIKGEIIIVGEGPQKKAIEQLIKIRKITNVKLLGYIDPTELIDLYYIADVFVSPSVWDDPMPLTIIEAMAAGLPVVVTRRGGIPLAVKDGYNGFFVRLRNATDIAKKVNTLLEDHKLREKMGINARLVVKDKFTWTKIADRFDEIYKKIK